METICAYTNSGNKFIQYTKEFIHKVSVIAQQDEERIRLMFSYPRLIKKFAEIANMAFLYIQEKLKNEISDEILNIKNYNDWQVGVYLEEVLLVKVHTIIQMLLKLYGRKIWRFVFQEFSY